MHARPPSIRLLTGLLSLWLSACFAGPRLAPDNNDRTAKAFTPAAGRGAIYVYRHSHGRGYNVPIPLAVDGRDVGGVANKTYYVVEVDPGSHDVWLGWSPQVVRNAKLSPIAVNVIAGQAVFVRAGTLSNRSHKTVDASTGKKDLLSCCKLAAPPVRAPSSLLK